ncbi:MAG TPA: copper resistance CopC family protein [Candidatus Binataceae bacterium]|nr:copper resistance CopC family protein [Candidatus Binataceae bacterium]
MASCVLTLIVGFSSSTSAHSFPEEEIPSAGSTVHAPPNRVTIKYDAPIEKLFASIEVLNAAGHSEVAGQPQLSSDGLTLSIPVNKLDSGEYTVKWRVVCVDTHHTEGSYSFTVAGNS